jgi:hemolysin activation/secretion protein
MTSNPFPSLFLLLIAFAGVPITSESALAANVLQAIPESVPKNIQDSVAQRVPTISPQLAPELPQPVIPPRVPIPEAPLPTQPLPPLPSPDELLPPPALPAEPETPTDVPATLFVTAFVVEGSTIFSAEDFANVTAEFTGRELSFAELLQVRTKVTQLYVERGYVTSGAFIPPQTLEGGVVKIQVIEGSLEDINVTGTRRLQRAYVRSRLRLAASTPLNVPRLLRGLQLLQLDPLIETISADLQAGVRPGTSLLQVQVTEADTFSVTPSIDNGRSPSVGSFRRQIGVTQANLTGLGDGFSLNYTNTDGSNGIDTSYTLPLNPRNGTLRLAYGTTWSSIIAPDQFKTALDIDANSRYYELTYRQPLFQSPTEEFALSLTASRQESSAEFLEENLPFPSLGADEEGRTRVSALRFSQEWTRRSSRQVLAARSQFSLGLNLLDSTISNTTPDSRFFAWRGQGQWVRLLAPDSLLLVRTDVQLSGDSLVPLEQFGLGGQETVRGYRQDALLTDNGALLSTELRLPILRVPEVKGVLQLTPFIDVGTTWNNSGEDPSPNSLIGVGAGLLWRMGDDFSARLDWGIPLIKLDRSTRSDAGERTWQESGVYFSVRYSAF